MVINSQFSRHVGQKPASWKDSLKEIIDSRSPSSLIVLDLPSYESVFESINPKGRNTHYSTDGYPAMPHEIPAIAAREIFQRDNCSQHTSCSAHVLKSCFDVVVMDFPTWTSNLKHAVNSRLQHTLESERCSQSRVMHWLMLGITCKAASIPPHEEGPYSTDSACHRVTGLSENRPKNPLDWQGPPNFFLVWNGTKDLTPMSMACLRSIMKHNPSSTVRIFSNSLDQNIIKPFVDRGFDLRIERFDLRELVKNTPAEAWYHSDELSRCIYKKQNLSNILRLLLLYHHGGIYLDFDIIVLHDLRFTKNTVGIQTRTLNGAVMAFEKKHPFVWECMQDFVSNFNGNIWGNNGPMVVSRAYRNTETAVNLLGEWSYYPVPFTRTRFMFTKPVAANGTEMQMIEKHALLVHLWNNLAVEHEYKLANDSITHRVMSPFLEPFPEEVKSSDS